MRAALWLPLLGLLAACPSPPAAGRAPQTAPPAPPSPPRATAPPPPPANAVPRPILEAEAKATPGGRAVLAAARQMIAADTVIKGSCWDYAYGVYKRAGFGTWRRQQTIYKARTRGPYAPSRLVQAGDWLYLINHVASLSTHSVIFVHWLDRKRGLARVITYVGGRRDDPGMYRSYDVSRIYQIIRPKPAVAPRPTARAPSRLRR